MERAQSQIPTEMVKQVFELCSEQVTSVTTYGGHNVYGGTHRYKAGTRVYDHQTNLWNDSFNPVDPVGVIDIECGQNHNMYHYGRNYDIDDEFVQIYIDEINTKYIKSEIDYPIWRNCVRESNKALKPYGVKIIEFKKKKLEQIIYTANIDEFYEFDIGGIS